MARARFIDIGLLHLVCIFYYTSTTLIASPALAADLDSLPAAGYASAGSDSGSGLTNDRNFSKWQDELYASKLLHCLARFPLKQAAQRKKKGHPVLTGLMKTDEVSSAELGRAELSKDAYIYLSIAENDPYSLPANPDIPYLAAEAQYQDGSSSCIYNFPDGSWRVEGGFLDGTYACRKPDGVFIIQYADGSRAMVRATSYGGEILRADRTVTKFSKSANLLRISSSKFDQELEFVSDKAGLSYKIADGRL